MGKIYTDDIGSRIEITLNSDLTDTSGAMHLFRGPPPGNELFERTSIIGYITSGVVFYDKLITDFTDAGDYEIQVKITYNDGKILHSETKRFTVYGAFE